MIQLFLLEKHIEKKSLLIFVNFLFDPRRIATNCWRKGVRNQKSKIDYQPNGYTPVETKNKNGIVVFNSKLLDYLGFFPNEPIMI